MDPQYTNVKSKLIAPSSAEIITPDIWRTDFDKDCLFGCGSSAYQFEGGANEDGKGQSIWDSWAHLRLDKIRDGTTGDVAIDQYHLYKEDVQLMKKIGVETYRFSISWPRILPGGKIDAGINKQGIKYYNSLIDELISNGIEPCVTLFHWDLPLALETSYGGFLSHEIVKDFVDYVELCFWEFGDRVKNWITFNEGWSYCYYGYVAGTFPPGHGTTEDTGFDHSAHKGCSDLGLKTNQGDASTEPYLVAHNMILAHATAVFSYRTKFQKSQGGKIGITNVTHFFEPLNDTDDEKNASIRALDWMFGWFTAPVTTGDYPRNMRERVSNRLPTFSDEERRLVKGSYDFIGVNYYTTIYATNKPKQPGQPDTYLSDRGVATSYVKHGVSIGVQTGAEWLYSVPRGIYNLLVYAKETYQIHLFYITENGVPDHFDRNLTASQAKGDCEMRVTYFKQHLWYLKKAIGEAGVNVKRYFFWSFADNFEWADGYTTRFGTFYVNFVNGHLTRSPKDSAIWWMNFFKNKSTNEIENMRKRSRSSSA